MNIINIDQEWSLKELVLHLEEIKSQVWDVIASFSCFEINKELEFKRQLKKQIYSLNFKEWQLDRIFEYICGDIDISVFDKIV